MCIRDRVNEKKVSGWDDPRMPTIVGLRRRGYTPAALQMFACLLYTSDAADERSSVDLGGRRIIKKKKRHTRLEDAA